MKCVVKLGGSLIKNNQIIKCIQIIEKWKAQTIIVPGGGEFADTVRISQSYWGFNDSIAHRMAVLAMQQNALLLHGLSPSTPIMDAISHLDKHVPVRIWSPQLSELDKAGIPHSWDITSDSLAGWLANIWQADFLILVKSAVIEHSLALAELQDLGIVDAAFHRYVGESNLQVKIINHAHLAHVHD